MNNKKGILFIALSTVLFSSMEVALKFVSGQFNPVQLTCTRFFIGGIFLLPFASRSLKSHGEKITADAAAYFALLGLFNVVLSMMFYQLSVMNANASAVAVLFSSNPVFVLFFAFLLIHERVKRHEVIALLLDVAGIAVIVTGARSAGTPAGFLFAGLSVVFFALYSVSGKKGCRRYGGAAVTCGSFLFGSLELFLFIALSHAAPVSGMLRNAGLSVFADIPLFAGYTPAVVPVFLYICIAVTGGGFVSYFMALEYTSPSLASLVFFIKPVLAPVFALLFLHETIAPAMLCGIAIIAAGSLVSFIPTMMEQRRKIDG
ncbi:MAG TPA: EamA family transporter [Treponema sp.]|nr:EamA family transporter [Treponema sp.]